MQTLVFIFTLITWALGAKTAEISMPHSKESKEISIVSKGVELKGTLTVPTNSKNYPLVLLIAGSGPTDRDGNQPRMKNNSFKKLSEALADKGIASVRYDKRGIAASYYLGFSNASVLFDDYVADAENWIHQLKANHKNSKIIVVGFKRRFAHWYDSCPQCRGTRVH
jgi:uncharacterized protein